MSSRTSNLFNFINSSRFKVEDSADNDYGKNSQYQCVSFFALPKESCVILGPAEWVTTNENVVQGKRRDGYYDIHHGWCRDREYKYDDSREKTYGKPDKILDEAECITIEKYTPMWAKKKVMEKFEDDGTGIYRKSSDSNLFVIKGMNKKTGCLEIRKNLQSNENNEIKYALIKKNDGEIEPKNKETEYQIQDALCVEGNTYPIKEYLKNKGYKWNRIYKVWENEKFIDFMKKVHPLYDEFGDIDDESDEILFRKFVDDYLSQSGRKTMSQKEKERFYSYVEDMNWYYTHRFMN